MNKIEKLVDLAIYKVCGMMVFPKKWYEYPPEYNREIHGPYNPSVYYGKRDTPLADVKLSELPAWFGRRNKSPGAIAAAFGRLWYKYQINWVQVKYPSAAFFYQAVAVVTLAYYFIDYKRYTSYRNYRYH